MERHVLLTVSKDREAASNVRFIRHFFDNLCDLRITLFYVAARAMDDNLRFVPSVFESSKYLEAPLEELTSSEARTALEHTRDWLVAQGCRENKLHTKAVYSRFGTVHDIIQEGHAGKYDAVLLGKRCVSWFDALLDDSVTNRILWERIDFPVWICRRPETGLTRHVLLCQDGSDASLRMADHVGFMAGAAQHQEIHLLHVVTDVDRSQDVFQAAKAALQENGVPVERIKETVLHSASPAQAILQHAHAGKFAVVALGRRKTPEKNPPARERDTSVTHTILKSFEDFSLWVSK